jgi:UDP-N-acetyl-D-mannosaminuronate dehydrogenase
MAARRVNLGMPAYAVDLLESETGDLSGRTVVVLGLAYRGGVKETAFSGAFDVVAELGRRGARPVVHDPLYTPEEIVALGLVPYDRSATPADAAILQADHVEYRSLSADLLGDVATVIDGRNWLQSLPEGVVRVTIGRGTAGGSVGQAAGSMGSKA